MTVEAMRDQLMHVYHGPTWRKRVKEMDDRQVIAIFRDMVETGRLKDYRKKENCGGSDDDLV
jgi:proline dehydrogenase